MVGRLFGPVAAGLLTAAVVLAVTGRLPVGPVLPSDRHEDATTVVSSRGMTTPGADLAGNAGWRGVLEALDRVRAKAWRRGEPEMLRAIYTPGSPALPLDRRMLGAYRERALRVRGVHLEFGPIRILSRGQGVVRLRVVDRLGPMAALRPDGLRLPLPRDRATRHELVLRRVGSDWRIAGVRTV